VQRIGRLPPHPQHGILDNPMFGKECDGDFSSDRRCQSYGSLPQLVQMRYRFTSPLLSNAGKLTVGCSHPLCGK
jgi:hypothetical protein